MTRSFQAWLELLLVSLVLTLSCYRAEEEEDSVSDLEKIKKYGTFYSERQILDFLDKHRRYSYIDESLKEYQLLRLTDAEVKTLVKRWPFITVEAFHKPLRTIVGGKLATRLGGKMIFLTEQAFKKYKIENSTEVAARRGLYALLSYLTSCKLRSVLQHSFAVVAGYWLDQTSFNIAKVFNETLPPEDSPIYKWPNDLLKPDLVFYINSPQTDTNLSEEQNKSLVLFKNRLATVFRRCKSPMVVELNTTNVYHVLVDDMVYHINKYLKNKYWFKLQLRYTRN